MIVFFFFTAYPIKNHLALTVPFDADPNLNLLCRYAFMKMSSAIKERFTRLASAEDNEPNEELHVCARVYEMHVKLRDELTNGLPNFLDEEYIDLVKKEVQIPVRSTRAPRKKRCV